MEERSGQESKINAGRNYYCYTFGKRSVCCLFSMSVGNIKDRSEVAPLDIMLCSMAEIDPSTSQEHPTD